MELVLPILVVLSFGFVLNGCRTAAPPVGGELPDPVGHTVNVHARPWNTELAPDARVVEVDEPPKPIQAQVVVCEAHRAFVVPYEDRPCVDKQIEYVYFIRSGRCFRVDGLPLPRRSLSSLAWASDRYLTFDRWSQPHYGIHYVVDTQEHRVVNVSAFPDQFYLDQQRPGSSDTNGG